MAIVLCLAGWSAGAAEPEDELLAIDIHGFVSQGYIRTTDNNYLAKSVRGSFELTEAGLNFTKPLTERLRAGLQLFTRKLGPQGDFTVKFDWFYLDYRWQDWLGFRAGRVKLPFGLYNDTSDVDSGRTFILLPQSIYPIQNRDFLLAQTGAELYGYADLRGGGALDYRLYYGTIFIDVPAQPGAAVLIQSFDVTYVAGGRLLWETPLPGLRVGGSVQALRLESNILFPAAAATATIRVPAVLAVASAEYVFRDLLLAAEYSRWRTETQSSNPALIPQSTTWSERAYALASYRLATWLRAGAYYSVLFPNVDRRSGAANMQHDVAATLRFDINTQWLAKIEGHYMHGTAALSSGLNDNRPLGTLERNWAALLIRTTAVF
jgi:hypothetical protein